MSDIVSSDAKVRNPPQRFISPETHAKMSAAKKGKKLSPETREKIRAANQGKVRSQETRENIRRSKQGKPSPQKGKPTGKPSPRKGVKASDETREKLSLAHKGQVSSPETRKKMSEAMKGRQLHLHSAETKAHLSQIKKEAWEALDEEEKDRRVRLLIRNGSKVRRNESSSIEEFVAAHLKSAQIVYEPQKRIGRYYVDFYLPAYKLCLEVAGCFWHCCEQCGFDHPKYLFRREKDAKRQEIFRSKGYHVLVLWEHDIRQNKLDSLWALIEQLFPEDYSAVQSKLSQLSLFDDDMLYYP